MEQMEQLVSSLTEMIGWLVKHEQIVGDHHEDGQGHPRLLSPRENAYFSERLGSRQPQGPLYAAYRNEQQLKIVLIADLVFNKDFFSS